MLAIRTWQPVQHNSPARARARDADAMFFVRFVTLLVILLLVLETNLIIRVFFVFCRQREKRNMGTHGGFREPVCTSVIISAVCAFLICAVFNASAAAAASPLTLASSTASPVAISAGRPDAPTTVIAFNNSGATAVDWLVTSSAAWLSFDTPNFGSNLAPDAAAAGTSYSLKALVDWYSLA